MDSNEKEFNGVDNNEEITEETVNESVADETTEPEVTEDIAPEETEPSEENNGIGDDAESEVISDSEEPEEATELIADEESADTDNTENTYGELTGEDELEKPEEKKKSNAPIIAVIVLIAVIIAILACMIFGNNGNKYNKLGYVNVSGRTVQQIADDAGVSLSDFLSEYGLPEDMPGDTTEVAAIYCMPAKVYLQNMIGIDYENAKTYLNIPEETTPNEPKTFVDKIKSIFVKEKTQKIDENTPWYIVEGELTVGDFSGGSVEEFKKFYGLSDDVTEETKIKEIQEQINKKTEDMLVEQQKQQEQSQGGDNADSTDENGANAADEAADGTDTSEAAPTENADTEAQNNAE